MFDVRWVILTPPKPESKQSLVEGLGQVCPYRPAPPVSTGGPGERQARILSAKPQFIPPHSQRGESKTRKGAPK